MGHITGLSHAAIKVADFEQAVRFYGEGLGLKIVTKKDDWAKIMLPDDTFLEISGGGEQVTNKSGITHLCFDTFDCDATFARAIEYGATPSRGDPYDLGELRISFVTAPTGEEVEFWFIRHDGLEREDIVDHKYVKGFVHVALTVPDMDAVTQFYGELGVPFKTGWGWGCSLKMDDTRELELFTEGEMSHNENGIVHFCLLTGDIEAAVARAVELGANLTVPPKDTPEFRLAFFEGLAGELVELFELK